MLHSGRLWEAQSICYYIHTCSDGPYKPSFHDYSGAVKDHLLCYICGCKYSGEKPDPEQIDDIIFKEKDIWPEESDTPFLKYYCFHAVVVIILTAALVITFW